MTQINVDFLIIGSGVAGLSFALKVAKFGSVALVTKEGIMDSNTSQAQGGIASVFDKVDSFDFSHPGYAGFRGMVYATGCCGDGS